MKESMLDMENYKDYVKNEKKNKICQKIKMIKKCFNCTFQGCNKKYSAPYNLKVSSPYNKRFITVPILEKDLTSALMKVAKEHSMIKET